MTTACTSSSHGAPSPHPRRLASRSQAKVCSLRRRDHILPPGPESHTPGPLGKEDTQQELGGGFLGRSGCDHSSHVYGPREPPERLPQRRQTESKSRAQDVSQGSRRLLVSRGVHCYPLGILARASLEIPLDAVKYGGCKQPRPCAGRLGGYIPAPASAVFIWKGKWPWSLWKGHAAETKLTAWHHWLPPSVPSSVVGGNEGPTILSLYRNSSTLSPRDISFSC